MSTAVKFGRHIKEFRLHLCQRSPSSKGVRDFVEKHYVEVKKKNPKFPILIRECEGVKPVLWARYEFGREKWTALDGLEADGVLKEINGLASQKSC